ncbi:MAG: DedA family protein [Sphingobacteriales bacterium]|nr:MAG: DedA family protein [Sphingobacteriales bacterium]TAF80205.1 MAG: DedA family protein [Sphingobacteriales bacterium]
MNKIWQAIIKLVDAQQIIHEGGFYLILFVIFAETGLFFGFFLPGDYLLFLAGLFVATHKINTDIITLVIGTIIAATAGNFVGYYFGYKTGPLLFKKEDSLFFKKKYIRMAEVYYNKQGSFALIMGRFIPIVRTFAPIIAGVVKLSLRRFTVYNILGAVLWVASLTLLGYFLGKEFEKQVNDYLTYIIVGFIIITSFPLIWSFVKAKYKSAS